MPVDPRSTRWRARCESFMSPLVATCSHTKPESGDPVGNHPRACMASKGYGCDHWASLDAALPRTMHWDRIALDKIASQPRAIGQILSIARCTACKTESSPERATERRRGRSGHRRTSPPRHPSVNCSRRVQRLYTGNNDALRLCARYLKPATRECIPSRVHARTEGKACKKASECTMHEAA